MNKTSYNIVFMKKGLNCIIWAKVLLVAFVAN